MITTDGAKLLQSYLNSINDWQLLIYSDSGLVGTITSPGKSFNSVAINNNNWYIDIGGNWTNNGSSAVIIRKLALRRGSSGPILFFQVQTGNTQVGSSDTKPVYLRIYTGPTSTP